MGIGIPISQSRPPLNMDVSFPQFCHKPTGASDGSQPEVERLAGFIRGNTALLPVPHVPEISLYLAHEAHDLWLKTEEEMSELGLPPPFWAFAWAGGQGLARYVLDHPAIVRRRRVVDFASGSGLVAIAAARAGAADVIAGDVDRFAGVATGLNAQANAVFVRVRTGDMIGERPDADVLLAGDVFYDRPFAERLVPWFDAMAGAGVAIFVGDPGRAYLPKERLEACGTYEVPVTRALEDAEVKRTTVWRWLAP